MTLSVWSPPLTALIAGVGAARAGVSPCWLLNSTSMEALHQYRGSEQEMLRFKPSHRNFKPIHVFDDEFDADASRISFWWNCDRTERGGQQPKEMAPTHIPAAATSVMFHAKLALAMWADQHAAIVAEQHPPTPPTAAPATGRPDSPNSDQSKEGPS